jgi:hypothetical protein
MQKIVGQINRAGNCKNIIKGGTRNENQHEKNLYAHAPDHRDFFPFYFSCTG